ncbi:hypothetical protein [Labilithrix luteola]|nr:hypothetical protein [Labilithrix luteola]
MRLVKDRRRRAACVCGERVLLVVALGCLALATVDCIPGRSSAVSGASFVSASKPEGVQQKASPGGVRLPPPPDAVVRTFGLSPFYTQYVDAGGLPVVASAKVSPYALREAAFLIGKMIGHRPDVLQALASRRIRFAVMSKSEMTVDIPEHSDLQPAAFWNRRARGLAAILVRPATSCGEENLLDLPGDPYVAENILVHEFAHTIHQHGMAVVDATFDARLRAAYDQAKATGLWSGTYAMTNPEEYWAEATQSWFDCNRANDREHGPIDTREKLEAYDAPIARLLRETFGEGTWRYSKPSKRSLEESTHLVGFDRASAGSFVWPAEFATRSGESSAQPSVLTWLSPAAAPFATSRDRTPPTTVSFVNRRSHAVELVWIDFDGHARHYADISPAQAHSQATFAGHVWMVVAKEDGRRLGAVIAGTTPGRAEIR